MKKIKNFLVQEIFEALGVILGLCLLIGIGWLVLSYKPYYDKMTYSPKKEAAKSWQVTCKNNYWGYWKGLCGFTNKEGKWVIKPQFSKAQRFDTNHQAIAFTSDGKAGVIDTSGQWISKTDIDEVRSLPKGTIAKQNGKYGITDDMLAWRLKPSFDEIDFDEKRKLFLVTLGKNKGILDEELNEVIPPVYSAIYLQRFGDSIVVKKGNKYGYLDKNLSWIVKPTFNDILEIGENYAIARKGTETVFLDQKGFPISKKKVLGLVAINKNYGLAAFYELDEFMTFKFGFVNSEGEWKIKPQFQKVEEFDASGKAKVFKNDEWYYIDVNGERITSMEIEH